MLGWSADTSHDKVARSALAFRRSAKDISMSKNKSTIRPSTLFCSFLRMWSAERSLNIKRCSPKSPQTLVSSKVAGEMNYVHDVILGSGLKPVGGRLL